MTPPVVPHCKDCRFWVSFQPGTMKNRTGECRRFPPQVVVSVRTDGVDENRGRYEPEVCSSTDSEWPSTADHAWCGEFQKGVTL